MKGWRPMETAPKDGSGIIILFHNGVIDTCHWAEKDEVRPTSGWVMLGQSFPAKNMWPIAWTTYSEAKAALLCGLVVDLKESQINPD